MVNRTAQIAEAYISSMDNILVVLHRPRDVVNIGGVVRAIKNMGFRRLRLVDPAPFDLADVRGIAHRSEDVLDRLEIVPDLDTALADALLVVGTTARTRGEHPVREDVRALAPQILARAAAGPVALLFGPEDNGLDNQALDRCGLIVRLPADPAYPSLNLAQAALLLLYELRGAAHTPAAPPGPAPATQAQMQTLYAALEQALRAVEFFKAGDAAAKLRSLRQVLQRAQPSPHEAALLTAMAREVAAFVRRRS